MQRTTTTARPLQRVIAVLTAFAKQDGWGVRELAAELDLPKSNVHRTLQELADEHMLSGNDEGIYVIAPDLLQLAASLLRSVNLLRIARPHLEVARDVGGESAILVSFDEARRQVIGIDWVPTANPVQYFPSILSSWTDIHLSASGRGVLAFLGPRYVDEILSNELKAADGAPIDVDALKGELSNIRSRGWAFTCGMRHPGAAGVCSPIFESTGCVVGGVVISWPVRPSTDLDSDALRLGKLAYVTAIAISKALGWYGKVVEN